MRRVFWQQDFRVRKQKRGQADLVARDWTTEALRPHDYTHREAFPGL